MADIRTSVKLYGWIFTEPERFEQVIKKAVATTTPQLPKLPQARSRVRTGRMFKSWQAENLGLRIRVASEGVAYTVYNEFGTSKMSAQPMLQPSVPEMVVLLSNAITREVQSLS